MKTKFSYYLLITCFILGSCQEVFAQVVRYSTYVTIDENGQKATEKTLLVQINNKDENWLSHIQIPHGPNEDFTVNYAHLLDVNGKIIRKLKKKELVTKNERSYQAF